MEGTVVLHICCAPCSIASLKTLQEKGFEPRGYFFNPNIHPYREFSKRKETLREYSQMENFPLFIEEEYLLDDFLRMVVNSEEQRCLLCYRLRLEATAQHARDTEANYFTTTLLISPYQKHEQLKALGEETAAKYGVPFLYEDFRPLFRESLRLAREKGLYVQGYCGCIFSEHERYGGKNKKTLKNRELKKSE